MNNRSKHGKKGVHLILEGKCLVPLRVELLKTFPLTHYTFNLHRNNKNRYIYLPTNHIIIRIMNKPRTHIKNYM